MTWIVLFCLGCLMVVGICGRYLWTSKIEIPGVRELVVERDTYKAASADLLHACELVEQWMLCGQPGPYSDSQLLVIVHDAIAKAKFSGLRPRSEHEQTC